MQTFSNLGSSSEPSKQAPFDLAAVTGLETAEVAVVAKAKLASKTLAIIHPD